MSSFFSSAIVSAASDAIVYLESAGDIVAEKIDILNDGEQIPEGFVRFFGVRNGFSGVLKERNPDNTRFSFIIPMPNLREEE